MGGEARRLGLRRAAKTSVWLATLPKDGPTRRYFFNGEALPW